MELNLSRLYYLIRKDFIVSRRAIGLFGLALFIVTGLIMLLASDEANGEGRVPPDVGEMVLGCMLFVIGTAFTLTIFREYRSAGKRIQFLATPASHLEKFLCKWIYTLPMYLIGSIVVFIVGYTFFRFIFAAAFDLHFVPLSEMKIRWYAIMIHFFILVHAIAFFLATLFNRYPIPKAIIASFVIYLITFIVVVLIARIVLWDYFTGFNLNNEYRSLRMPDGYMSYDWIERWGPRPFIYVTAVFLWIVSYFKVKEKEA